MSTHGAWDSANNGGYTLSNSDRTASNPTVNQQQIRTTDGNSAGKVYAEIKLGTVGSMSVFFDQQAPSRFFFWDTAGSAGTDITPSFTIQGYVSNDTLQFALDFGNLLFWAGTNNTNWNNNGGNPATGVGGIAMSSATYLIGMTAGVSLAVTGTIDATAPTFLFTPPTGYSPWFGSASTFLGAFASMSSVRQVVTMVGT